ncbi:(R)-specific enoyl-CoA hydratase [Phytophthora citrophthora]|uniref:(R)-specific enoyl-CoA hydratase n=1 Tax=Phytophthora citrophthora TaxID=4793 RepID=A0AAD9LG70_9STRA|nr:(R)-specific enoyl-CoA hydratase [Phytophthora citrophthora]
MGCTTINDATARAAYAMPCLLPDVELINARRSIYCGRRTHSGVVPAEGVEAQLTHAFSIEDTRAFAELSGDNNPLHVDEVFARQHTGESKPVVQGLLSASLFATIFGRTLPGAVYVKQDLRWRAPLLVDEEVMARIRVLRVRKRFLECETVCTKADDGVVVVDGHATLLLPSVANQVAN